MAVNNEDTAMLKMIHQEITLQVDKATKKLTSKILLLIKYLKDREGLSVGTLNRKKIMQQQNKKGSD
jgi:hypothetical protein